MVKTELILSIVIVLASLAGTARCEEADARALVKKIHETLPKAMIAPSVVKKLLGVPLPLVLFQVIPGQSADANYVLVAPDAPPPLPYSSVHLTLKFGRATRGPSMLDLVLDTKQVCITESMLTEGFGMQPTRTLPMTDGGGNVVLYEYGASSIGALFTSSSCAERIALQDASNTDWSKVDPEIAEFYRVAESNLLLDPSKKSISGNGFQCRVVEERPGEISTKIMNCSCAANSTSHLCGFVVSVQRWETGGALIGISRTRLPRPLPILRTQ